MLSVSHIIILIFKRNTIAKIIINIHLKTLQVHNSRFPTIFLKKKKKKKSGSKKKKKEKKVKKKEKKNK
jgi:hypothetical protein